MERVQKLLSNRGYCSRRKAEDLIKEGRVKVNDTVITIGDQATNKDKNIKTILKNTENPNKEPAVGLKKRNSIKEGNWKDLNPNISIPEILCQIPKIEK